MRNRLSVSAFVLMCGSIAVLAAEPLTDPMRPDYAQDAPVRREAAFDLTAIFYSPDRQQAVVNGTVVSRGDRVDGARVVEIRPDALDLLFRGELITRRLPTMELRK